LKKKKKVDTSAMPAPRKRVHENVIQRNKGLVKVDQNFKEHWGNLVIKTKKETSIKYLRGGENGYVGPVHATRGSTATTKKKPTLFVAMAKR